jgi:hypothetical protein
VERLNAELTGTLTRLQGAQAELVVPSAWLRCRLPQVARGAQSHRAIELNAELVGDLVKERGGADMEEAAW